MTMDGGREDGQPPPYWKKSYRQKFLFSVLIAFPVMMSIMWGLWFLVLRIAWLVDPAGPFAYWWDMERLVFWMCIFGTVTSPVQPGYYFIRWKLEQDAP